MRTVPVVLEIARRARQLAADDAWIVDFTNPVGIVTRALLDDGHRAIGLCNVAINFQRQIAAHLGVAPERVLVDQVGLNHLTWIRSVWLDGRDVLADVLDSFGDHLAQEIGLPRQLLDDLGAIPSYYLRYFYAERAVVEKQRHEQPRAAVVAEIERGLLDLYRDPTRRHQAGAARAARRRVLQRGRDAAARGAVVGQRRDAGRGHAQRRHACRARR